MNNAVRTPAEFTRLIALTDSLGIGHMAELLRPAQRGELNMVTPTRDTSMPPLWRMAKTGRPVVALVGDDDYLVAGPVGWACAGKLRSWARFAIVHGTGARPEHYALAAAMALQVRRLLLIETSSEGAQLWAAFLRERTPELSFMGVLPRVGSHPVMPPRGEVH